jgi:uncharacterized protein YbcC (UPF0753/DUF2309 family)
VIEHATHFLPAQGPIKVFIHHNTLHAFEDLSFHDAVKQGGKVFGCQPYLPEDGYRQYLARGRIRDEDLSAALIDDLGDEADTLLGFLGTRYRLRLAMLKHPLRLAPAEELRWFVAETDALTRFCPAMPPALKTRFLEETRHWVLRDLAGNLGAEPAGGGQPHDYRIQRVLAGLIQQFGASSIERWSERTWESFSLQALWRICRSGVHGIPAQPSPQPATVRHRDLLLEATGADSDLAVHDVLIRFCSSFLDQGISRWPLPRREEGFFRAFVALYKQSIIPIDSDLKSLSQELARLDSVGLSPLESIEESLELLGVDEVEWEPFIIATLLALRGFAGMIWQMESRGDRVAHPAPAGSLVEFLAVRLILERLSLSNMARQLTGHAGPLAELRHEARARIPRHDAPSVEQRAFLVFQLAQVLGWLPADLYRLTKLEWSTLVAEIEAFSGLVRRRVFHAAYERHYRIQTLDAISIYTRGGERPAPPPRFQVVCCLDEREESFRRHLEEVAPDVETFGAAGFFGVAMYYRGAADAHYVPLCPIVIRPQHWVEEDVVYTQEETHRFRSQARRALGMASHQLHVGSRTFTGGALLAACLGALASIPLVARVLFPRLTARIRRTAGRLVETPQLTQLQIERSDPAPGTEEGQIGYTVDEMAAIVRRLLCDIGLTSRFSRLVFIVGHGSSSLNNPHESAHDCGACGGGRGGPNARALARMANDPRVRDSLAAAGIHVPPQTVFVGSYHNTCDESVTYFDLDRLPTSHKREFDAARSAIDGARERNAHERCRRFESAPLTISPEAALIHVEARSEDLAQTRPEYGHATNAICIVGRRARTRGLYLDRRAFLVSYDPDQDDAEQAILTRILQAAVPVCAGINLEYYFSFVDPAGWGCGTKLPHNITSLLSIMDGAASDLRPGLPWQMVEIHEPVRLLFIIETSPEAMLRIMQRNEVIGKLVTNGWVQMATLDPQSSEIYLFSGGRFERYQPESTQLPAAESSVDWYRGWRDHLEYAVIDPGAGKR